MTLPLSHITVLDLSRILAGPWCSQLLADLESLPCREPAAAAIHDMLAEAEAVLARILPTSGVR